MDVRIEPGWRAALRGEFEKPYFAELAARVRAEYSVAGNPCYPPAGEIFAAFDETPYDAVKVVVMGQDPYHGPGQANGLAFSVSPGVGMPPSLVNIFREVSAETGAAMPADGDLTRWARQGVLLLNSTLTVRAHQANSHAGIGWARFTEAAVRALAEGREGLVFMLWGRNAQERGRFIDRQRHLVLTSAHPSPMSANRGGWFGNGHFTTANRYLEEHGKRPIVW